MIELRQAPKAPGNRVPSRYNKIVALVAILGLGSVLISWSSPEPLFEPMLATNSVAALVASSSTEVPVEVPAAKPPALSAASVPSGPAKRLNQIDHLIASGTPVGLWAAYRLVRSCLNSSARAGTAPMMTTWRFPHTQPWGTPRIFSSIERGQGPDPWDPGVATAAQCADVSAEHMRARIQWVAQAARSGIAGAAFASAKEGPFGDPSALWTRPDDPSVEVWLRTTLDQIVAEISKGNGWLATVASMWLDQSRAFEGNRPALYRELGRLADATLEAIALGKPTVKEGARQFLTQSRPTVSEWSDHPGATCVTLVDREGNKDLYLRALVLDRDAAWHVNVSDPTQRSPNLISTPELLEAWCPK